MAEIKLFNRDCIAAMKDMKALKDKEIVQSNLIDAVRINLEMNK